MDKNMHDFISYLLFFFAWAGAVFVFKRFLIRFNKNNRNGSSYRKNKSSLKAKLPVYVSFQLLLTFFIFFNRYIFVLLIAGIALWSLFEFTVQINKSSLNPGDKYAISIIGFILTSGMVLGFNYLGKVLPTFPLLYLLFCIAISDTFSQVFGESIGGKSCMPRISPAKTWSGLIGGGCMCIFAAFIFYLFFMKEHITLPFLPLSALMIFIAATIGDSSISMIKRRLGIKDFSNLLGSQGGMIDRIDSMLIVSPLAALLVALT